VAGHLGFHCKPEDEASFLLILNHENKLCKGSEALLNYGGYDPDLLLNQNVQKVFPYFQENHTFQSMLSLDGRISYFICQRAAWSRNTWILSSISSIQRDLKLLQIQGENFGLKIRSNSSVGCDLENDSISHRHLNQLFSVYYDLLVHASGNHNCLSWNIPKTLQIEKGLSALVDLLSVLHSFRLFHQQTIDSIKINLIPYAQDGRSGYKLILDQKALPLECHTPLGITTLYMWIMALKLGYQKVELLFSQNDRDIFSFTFLEQSRDHRPPPMLIGQSSSWFSDPSLHLLKQFNLESVRFFPSLELFIQTALCSDPTHVLMVLDFGSFSYQEMEQVYAPLKDHKALSIIGSADQISRVPSFWRGPAFIQTHQFPLDLDRLFSFFSKRGKTLNIQFGQL